MKKSRFSEEQIIGALKCTRRRFRQRNCVVSMGFRMHLPHLQAQAIGDAELLGERV
jgi:hypothetical protein